MEGNSTNADYGRLLLPAFIEGNLKSYCAGDKTDLVISQVPAEMMGLERSKYPIL